ncbi:MAG: IS110 family transposase [Anaerolineales bacterium]
MRILVGIDPSKQHHQVSFLADDPRRNGHRPRQLTITNDHSGFQRLLDRLNTYQAQGDHVEVAIEPSGHYWENLSYFLHDHGYPPQLVNPFHVSRYTEIWDNTPTKTDPKDSQLVATLLREGRTLYNNLPQGAYAELRRLTTVRRDLLQERRRLRVKLHVWVDRYFPEYRRLFSDLAGPTSLGILAKYGGPKRIAQTPQAELAQAVKQLSRGKLGETRARQLKEQAAGSVGQTRAPRAAQLELKLLIAKIRQNGLQVKQVEEAIQRTLRELSEAQRLETIPGVGWRSVAVFLGVVGPVSRYPRARSIEKLAGLNLWERSSGKHQGERHISRRGRSDLRQLAYQLAVCGMRHNDEFRAFYEEKLKRSGVKLKALVALGAKMLRVMYGVAKSQQRYKRLAERQQERNQAKAYEAMA